MATSSTSNPQLRPQAESMRSRKGLSFESVVGIHPRHLPLRRQRRPPQSDRQAVLWRYLSLDSERLNLRGMISLSYEESDARSGVIDCAPNCKWRSLTAYIQYEYGYCTSTSTILVGTVLGSEVHDGVGDPLCIAASAVPRWPADSFNDTLCVTLNVAVHSYEHNPLLAIRPVSDDLCRPRLEAQRGAPRIQIFSLTYKYSTSTRTYTRTSHCWFSPIQSLIITF
jgi:hypothetical protein